MRFVEPWLLLLLIPVVAGLVLSARHIHGMMRLRKRFALVVRFALACCLVIAIAEPEAHRPNVGTCVMIVADRSDSITDSDRKLQETAMDEVASLLGEHDLAGLVVFGKEPAVDHLPARHRSFGRILTVTNGGASDLAAAIRLASASFPDGKARRIVLLSDGNETAGDAQQAAEAAAIDGIEIDTVVLGTETNTSEAAIVGLRTPEEARVNQPFDLRIDIDSTHAQTGEIVLDRDGVMVRRIPVQLAEGRNTFTVPQALDETGFYRYRATLRAANDGDDRNNVGAGFVPVRGKPKTLLVQESTGSSPLANALTQQGVDVELVSPGGIPVRSDEFQAYDSIVFNDVNAASLPTPIMEAVRANIQESGVGFAMVGGENSFLPGGWFGTPIAVALPVDLNVRQRKTFPSTSILVVADVSGSMAVMEDGVQKVRLAAKAAEQTVNMLSPIDRVGVAGSGDKIDFVAPMQALANKSAVIGQIRLLDTQGGGIYIRASMEFAIDALRRESTKVRHLILLADGNDCDTVEGSLEIATAMRSEKITTSVVAIGDGKDVAFLKVLAATGGGQFYLATKASQLPAIFTQDAAIMSRSAIEEGAFLPKVSLGEEALRGIDPGSIPPLFAYCLTDSRPLARTGMRTQKDDPLLATWQYGLGTSMAFTSDAQPRWAVRWLPWGGFGQFWAQAVRSIARRSTANRYRVGTTLEGAIGQVEVQATGTGGEPLDSLDAEVRLLRPDGTSVNVPVSASAPGVFKGRFETGQLGSYIVTVVERDPSGRTRVSTSGFSVAYPPEYRSRRANRPLLAQMAQTTGGVELQSPAEALRPLANPGYSVTPLWTWFVLAAALILPFDVAVRRIAIPLGQIFAAMATFLRRRRSVSAPVPNERVDRLRAAKERGALPSEPTVAPIIIAEKPAEERTEREPVVSGSVSSALLEAKRKKKDGS